MDENNRRESIEFERSVSIGTQDTTYYYHDKFQDSVSTIFISVFHFNESNYYVIFLLELPSPKENTVVLVSKERKHLFLFIDIGTDTLLLNDRAYNTCATKTIHLNT